MASNINGIKLKFSYKIRLNFLEAKIFTDTALDRESHYAVSVSVRKRKVGTECEYK